MVAIYKNFDFTNAASAVKAANATKAASNLGKAQVATQIGQVVGDIAVGLLQNKTQQDFNKAKIEVLKEDVRLKALTDEQRLELDKKIANSVNDVAKLRVYEETLGTVGVGVINANKDIYVQKLKNDSKTKTTGYYIIGGIVVLLLGATVLIYLKKNK
jgi:hypothetical protein